MRLRTVRERARGKLQRALREVLDEHASAQRQWWQDHSGLEALRDEVGALRAEAGALRAEVHEFEVRARRDLCYAADVAAAQESALLVRREMQSARRFPCPEDTLRFAAGLVAVNGMVLEFGVASGYTLNLLVQALPGRTTVGFDVFTGLPEDWRGGFPAGMFAQDQLPEVPGARLVVGLFADTLPRFLAQESGPIALLHLDADLYSSTRTVLELVGSRLQVGSVVLFDEYFNYEGWQGGEYLAWEEFVARTGLTYRYAGYTYNNEQVAVVITGTPATADQLPA